MPPLPNVSKVIRCAFNYVGGPTGAANIIHVAYTGAGGSGTDLAGVAADLRAAWGTNIVQFMSNGVELAETKLEDLTSDTAPVATDSTAVAGLETTAQCQDQVAALISLKIARRYRGGHPRLYIPYMVQANLATPSFWTSDFQAALKEAFDDVGEAIAASSHGGYSGLSLVSVSYRSGNEPRVTPVVDPVIGSSVQPRLCTQRRRLGTEIT